MCMVYMCVCEGVYTVRGMYVVCMCVVYMWCVCVCEGVCVYVYSV